VSKSELTHDIRIVDLLEGRVAKANAVDGIDDSKPTKAAPFSEGVAVVTEKPIPIDILVEYSRLP
jgi:hypothetical protein